MILCDNSHQMYRKPNNQQKYKASKRKQSLCPFCHIDDGLLVREFKHFRIILNKFPYDFWDLRSVEEHLMVLPLRHLQDFGEFSLEEIKEFMEIIQEYSALGYDSFTRSPHSTLRSQTHIHTHLIKTTGKEIKKISYDVATDFLEYES